MMTTKLLLCGLIACGLLSSSVHAFNAPLFSLKPSLRQGKAISCLKMQMHPASSSPSRRDMLLASSAALAAAVFPPKLEAFAEVVISAELGFVFRVSIRQVLLLALKRKATT
jgi:hypothetical protein